METAPAVLTTLQEEAMKRTHPASQNYPPAPFRGIMKSGKTVLVVVDLSDKQIEEILDILTKRDYRLPSS